MLQGKVSEIIADFLNEGDENYKDLRNNLSHYKNIFQYLYLNFFPEIYCSTEKRCFHLKSNFQIIFKTFKDKKKLEDFVGKNSHNYEEIRNETCVYEQKAIKIDEFNETEEKEVKERIERRNQKRTKVAESNKLFFKKRKNKRTIRKKKTRNKMWGRLGKLNKEFRDIRVHNKNKTKMSKYILRM